MRFIDDNVLYVVSTKKVTPIRDNLVWAPYKGMGYYEAIPLDYGDERSVLEKKKKDKANKQYGEQICLQCLNLWSRELDYFILLIKNPFLTFRDILYIDRQFAVIFALIYNIHFLNHNALQFFQNLPSFYSQNSFWKLIYLIF